MKTAPSQKPKGPWIHRFSIRLFTIILGVLIFWVLGFLVQDIESIRGPQYDKIEKKHVDQQLLSRRAQVVDEITELDRHIRNKQEEMRIVRDNSQNLQQTINQLIQLKRLTIEKLERVPAEEDDNLTPSLDHFLVSQQQYQEHVAQLADLTARKQGLESERLEIDKKLEEQRAPARREFKKLQERHNIRLAALQLLILLPLLAVAGYLVAKQRGSIYFPLFLGFGGATLLKVILVIHEYFPTRYFKYILVIGLLIVVVKLLIYFIRMVAFPQQDWLMRQYREAYERFLCPVCEYPIRTGPRRYLYWTRRTVNKFLPSSKAGDAAQEPYACPACGTRLFEECESCHGVRHSLLPHCAHCNAKKEMPATEEGWKTTTDKEKEMDG